MRKFILLLTIFFFLSGCSWLSPFSGNTKSAQTDYSRTFSDERYQAPAVANGKLIILNNRIIKSELNKTNKTQPLNVWQKFCRWLGNLTILGILIIVGGLFAGTGGPLLFLYQRFSAFKKALTQTVTAIEKSKTVEEDPKLKTTLSSVQDTDTKMLIDNIKSKNRKAGL